MWGPFCGHDFFFFEGGGQHFIKFKWPGLDEVHGHIFVPVQSWLIFRRMRILFSVTFRQGKTLVELSFSVNIPPAHPYERLITRRDWHH